MTISIKTCILAYLGGVAGYVWGGELARKVHEETKSKEGVIERRARELCEAKLIDPDYAQVNGKGPKCIRYRLHRDIPDTPQSLAL